MMIQKKIENKLSEAFSPIYLKVLNESYMHNVPKGSESHFKVIVVSYQFEGKRLLARHRLVNEILKEELAHSIHALAIHTYTLSEWHEVSNIAPDSPKCLGGNTL